MTFKLRPEVNEPKYWIHIALIAVIVLGILKYAFDHDMFSYGMLWKVAAAIAIADITVHTLLKLD